MVEVEALAGADVFDVGTDPRESRPSVCLESRPLEWLPVVLSRSGGGGGTSRSDIGRGGKAGARGEGGAVPRGDIERDGEGDGITPGAALDFLGGGENPESSTGRE